MTTLMRNPAVSSVPPDLRPTPAPARKPKNPAGPDPGDPFGLSPGLRRGDVSLLKYLSSFFGAPSSQDDLAKRASGFVSGSVNPIIDNLTAEAKRRIGAGAPAIEGVTAEYAKRLGGIGDTVRGDNAAAADLEQRSGGSLRDYLSQAGGKAAGEVGHAVGAGAPEGSALANAAAASSAGVGELGKGIAGESAARGYTGLSELNAHGAAAQRYADELPGLASLEGGQTLRGFTGKVEGDLKSQTDDLLAQIPGMTAGELQTLEGNETTNRGNKASLLGSFLGGALDRNSAAAIAKAGLEKDQTGAAIDWTTALGYKTDANGNPVYDSNGNLVPTASTVKAAGAAGAKGAKAHTTAVANLAKARDKAAGVVRTLATKLSKAGTQRGVEPVTPTIPSRQGRYKKKGGGFTNDPAQAETKPSTVAVPAKTYQEIFKLAMAQPEVQALADRYALKPAEVAKIVQQGLAAAGVTPPAPAPKPKTTATIPTGPTVPGVLPPP